MLIVFRHDEKNLPQVSELVFSQCFKALKDFHRMFTDIPILNYPPPEAIGFGVARGSASYLLVGEEILDYSGKLLNLAARLNELARPLGIVVDGNYQYEVIPKKFRKKFKNKSVYLRGIAEEVPISIFFSEQVSIHTSALNPIKEHEWKFAFKEKTVAELNVMDGQYEVQLPNPPLFPQMITAEFGWPDLKVKNNFVTKKCSLISHKVDAFGNSVIFDLDEVKAMIKDAELVGPETVHFRVHYIPKPKTRKKK